jgi:hypothetical protein
MAGSRSNPISRPKTWLATALPAPVISCYNYKFNALEQIRNKAVTIELLLWIRSL